MGGKSTSTTAVRLNAISVSTSALGVVIPKVWGTGRLKTNMLWYGNFQSKSHSSSQGGKGGSSTSNTTYTYTAALALGLCSGTISAVNQVYLNKSVYTNGSTTALAQAGLSLATGAIGQSVWSWLSSNSPSQAIGYSGIAYLYASSYTLDSSGNPPNVSVEVTSSTAFSSVGDAKPDVILTDFFTSTLDGLPGWPSGALGSLTNYGTYCLAANLLLSPVIDQQVKASQFIDDMMASTNSMCWWSEGTLKFLPLGTLSVTGNSTTWNPSLTPVYTITDSAMIPPSDGEPPLSIDISDQTDAYNIVQVEFLDRTNQYNTAIATRQDDSNISQYGPRKMDPKTLHMICDPTIAANVAQIILEQTLYIRGTYTFTLPWSYALLEPGDLLGLTDAGIGLSNFLVRITQIDDDEFDVRTITAQEVPIGTASPPIYTHQDATSFAANQFVAPGSCSTPVLIAPPATLTDNALEVWIATSGGSNWGGANVWTSTDGTNYQLTGVINGGCRYGVTTSAMGVVADPDTTTTLGVNLAASTGTLTSTSLSAVNAGATLCLVDSELIAYETATLTSANHYNLTYLRRGFAGTTIAAHSSGAPFVRLDGTEFAFTYQPMQAGATIYIKLQAFNLFGNSPEAISGVTAYSITLPTRTGATTWSSVVGIPANVAALTGTEAIQNSQVTISGGTISGIGTGNGTTVDNSLVTATGIGAVKTDASNAPSSILNSSITVASGVIGGIGSGTGTAVGNSLITISGGAIGGIGSGSGTVVANSAITVASGVLTGIGTPSITVDNSLVTPTGIGAVKTDGTNAPASLLNSTITITSGAITGIGTGSGTAVANSAITISSGVLAGIGTSGVVVDNATLQAALTGGSVVPAVSSTLTGQGGLATANYYQQTTDPGSVANGSFWADTSNSPNIVLKLRYAGAWSAVANFLSGVASSPRKVGSLSAGATSGSTYIQFAVINLAGVPATPILQLHFSYPGAPSIGGTGLSMGNYQITENVGGTAYTLKTGTWSGSNGVAGGFVFDGGDNNVTYLGAGTLTGTVTYSLKINRTGTQDMTSSTGTYDLLANPAG